MLKYEKKNQTIFFCECGRKKRVENRSQKAIKTNDATKCDFHHVLVNYANEDEVMKVKIRNFPASFSIRIRFLQQMRFSFCVNFFSNDF